MRLVRFTRPYGSYNINETAGFDDDEAKILVEGEKVADSFGGSSFKRHPVAEWYDLPVDNPPVVEEPPAVEEPASDPVVIDPVVIDPPAVGESPEVAVSGGKKTK